MRDALATGHIPVESFVKKYWHKKEYRITLPGTLSNLLRRAFQFGKEKDLKLRVSIMVKME